MPPVHDGNEFDMDDTTIGAIPTPRATNQRHPVLAVLEGDDARRFHELQIGATFVGRDPSCELPIADATASRRHACLRLERTPLGPVLTVEDLGSTNGTYVNGERLIGSTRLAEHDKLRVGGTLFAYLQRDDLELEADRRLLRLATYDSLTGLLNRNAFLRELAREVERARRYGRAMSLLMLDLDHFKSVNDTWGHPTGDRVLAQIGRILRACTRNCDHAGRYGGEECGVILTETGLEGARVAAERIRSAVASADFGLPGTRITVSVGGATLSDDIATPEQLVARADAALYAAKNAGRNTICIEG
jgi:two-component system cell cycle response regulator